MPTNPALPMIDKCHRAADELQRKSDQIVTPNGPDSAKSLLADLAFAVRWLIEDHSVMSALADSLHQQAYGPQERVRLDAKDRDGNRVGLAHNANGHWEVNVRQMKKNYVCDTEQAAVNFLTAYGAATIKREEA